MHTNGRSSFRTAAIFLYSALRRAPETGIVCVGSLDWPDRRVVLESASRAVFAPPGYLLSAKDGSLRAQRFDHADPSASRMCREA